MFNFCDTMNNLFIVKYKDDDEQISYAIDCDIYGYERINKDAPIVSLVIDMLPGEIRNINMNNQYYPFQLIAKSKNLQSQEMQKKLVIEEMQDILINKLIEYNDLSFLHTTDLNNLESIYDSGYIYSRNKVETKSLRFNDIANHNVLSITDNIYHDCARFYLRKNTPAGYLFKGNNCILVCDYDIIKSNNEMYITEKICTANNYFNKLNNITNLEYLTNVFRYKYVFNEQYQEDKSLKDFKSAEFLCRDKVSLKYINTIILENDEQKEWFYKKFPNWDIKIIVDKEYFKRSWRCGEYD